MVKGDRKVIKPRQFANATLDQYTVLTKVGAASFSGWGEILCNLPIPIILSSNGCSSSGRWG